MKYSPVMFRAVTGIALSLGAPLVRADISGFGNLSGFTINQSDSDSAPGFSAGKIHLTYLGNTREARSIFYNTPQSVSQFTASFTYQAPNPVDTFDTSGACFVLQNSPAGIHAIGGTALQFGYGQGNITSSAAISLELVTPSNLKTGLYTNGTVGNGAVSTSPVNLLSGDPINVTLSYDGSLLQETLFDTVTSASFSQGYLTNLPSLLGGSTALVGFTASTNGFDESVDQYFSNFQYSTTAVPEPVSLSMIGVGSVFALRRRRR